MNRAANSPALLFQVCFASTYTSGTVAVPNEITLPAGDVSARADVVPQRRTGTSSIMVVLEAPGRETRLPVRASVTCPPPVIAPGSTVRIVVNIGQVRASVPGEARQPGRIGDVIRVSNRVTRGTLLARVVSAEVVEVVQ